MDIQVRLAQKKDLLAIYKLVIELAIYEKEPDAVTASLADYEAAFEEGIFEAMVATTKDERIVGMMIYYMTYSTWKGRMLYLEDFVINSAYRSMGIGQLLYDRLLQIAKEKNSKLVKWQVLDWNKPAIAFYKKNKAIIENEWWNCKVFIK